ncbi:MAG: pyridoxamine 5'-phosphate oxidase family protein [Candidatus Bathyarchaeia archaeon]
MASFDRYIPMTDDEVWTFLAGQKIMSVATISAKTQPHNTPVWYVVHDRKLYFRAAPSKVKVRNIKTNPLASCTVESGEKYTELRGVTILAEARVVTDESLRQQINAELLRKYEAERNYVLMPKRWREMFEFEEREIIELTPIKIASWDNGKWLHQKHQH